MAQVIIAEHMYTVHVLGPVVEVVMREVVVEGGANTLDRLEQSFKNCLV